MQATAAISALNNCDTSCTTRNTTTTFPTLEKKYVSFMDLQWDQLTLQGTVYTAADFSNKGYFHFTGGTGIFKNAEGWMNSIGQFDQNGVNTLSAAGEITEPSNNN